MEKGKFKIHFNIYLKLSLKRIHYHFRLMQKQKLLVTHLLRDIQKLQMLRETQQRNGYFSFSFDILDEGILHLRTATFQDNCPVNM